MVGFERKAGPSFSSFLLSPSLHLSLPSLPSLRWSLLLCLLGQPAMAGAATVVRNNASLGFGREDKERWKGRKYGKQGACLSLPSLPLLFAVLVPLLWEILHGRIECLTFLLCH